MANIARINEIFSDPNRGPDDAATFALQTIEFSWVAKLIRDGEWDPNYRSTRKRATNDRPQKKSTPPLPRTGKTARTGGKSASNARKAKRSAADAAIRAAMKGK